MDLMTGVANMAMDMKAAQFAQNYSIALEAKVLDTMEMEGQEVLKLMNSVPAVPKGEYIDVYA